MPELPEVECVRRKLYTPLINKTIESVDVLYPKFNNLKPIKNETILDIKRTGKYLIFCLSNYYLISHLRMEGKYFIKKEDELTKHDLVRFRFKDFNLIYNDTRKFGVFYLFNKSEDIYNIDPLNKVSKEPFTITKEELYSKLNNKSIFIKTALLDQSIISGLGNIYVDEVLFMSHINPYRPSSDISIEECDEIIKNSITVLNNSILKGGSTIKSFSSLDGEIGHFQNDLLCHNKEFERCPNCNGFIIKNKCNGRGTYYCPSCQPLYNRTLYAITGGFSSGKSTALNIISKLGYKTFSLDDIYKVLIENDLTLKRELKKAFNVTAKSELKEFVFKNPDSIKELNNITHKYIFKELFRLIDESKKEKVFVEVPLLFESKLNKCFKKTICIKESDSIRDLLLKNKGFSIDDYSIRMKNQLDTKTKSELSDYIVYNNNALTDLESAIKELLKKL